MKLLLARHLWGLTEKWEQVFPRIQAAGFEAIEAPLPDAADHDRFQSLLNQYGFSYIAMIFTKGGTLSEHIDSFNAQVSASRTLQPILINSHSGQDGWDEALSKKFFTEALALEATLEIPVAHETHRGRILFNPWVTLRLLKQFEKLHLCCDLSHWVCVCERLLDSELDNLQLCVERSIHLHTRVGYEEGPQVPDPRAPEYQLQLESHERWWQSIWDAQSTRKQAISTVTPEYGPPPYLHTLPYSNMAVADLWEICNWQAQRDRAMFEKRYATKRQAVSNASL